LATCAPGSGVRLLDWPGNDGGRAGKRSMKHCGVCGECTAVRCWNGSGDHVWCRRHELMADRLLGEAGQ